jgi:hypothetical protein
MSSVEVEELERLLASATLPGVQAALRALLEKEREKVRPIDDATSAYDFLTNYVLVDKKTIAELYTIEPHADIRKMLILLFCLLNKKRTTIVLDEYNTLISSSIIEILKAITFNKLKGHLEFRQFANTDAPYCEFTGGNTRIYLDFDNLDTIIDESGVMMFVENPDDEIHYTNEDDRDAEPEIYSVTEDVLPFLESFRANILGYAGENNIVPIQEFENQYEGALAKPKLNLQLHQEIIVTGVCNKIAETLAPGGAGAAAAVSTKFLVGVLPRGGKTYIAGGIIRDYMKQTLRANPEKSLNIIWITATPNETKSQVGKDLIEKFQDLNEFVFIGYPFAPSAACATEEVCRSTKKHSVIFCSTQLLINPSSTGKAFLQGMITNADMFFFDEAHKTGSGKQTKAKIESIIGVKPTVFLTATYYSTIEDYGLTRENTFIWDYTDVKQTRKLDELPENITGIHEEHVLEESISHSSPEEFQQLEKAQDAWTAAKQTINENAAVLNLKKRFGEGLVGPIILDRIKNDETPRAMARDYHNFPNLNFISHDMPAGMIPIKDMFEKMDKVRIEGLVDIVTKTLEYITVFCHQETTESRFSFENHDTILMFVPTCTKMGIEKVMKTWATTLLENRKFDSYEVACILDEGGEDEVCEVGPAGAAVPENTRAMNLFGNQPALASKAEKSIMENYKYGEQPDISLRIRFLQNTKEKDIKQQIQEIEDDLQLHYKGLIVLAGSKLSTGVSLPCTDVVFLLNDDKSEDTVIQKMYRALTPSRGKNETFVVDYNPVRSFAAIYGYTLLASGEEQKFKEGKKNKRSEANKATAAVTEGKIKALLADTYNWHKVGDAGVKTPEQKSAYVDELYAAALKDADFRCHLNKQLCALPAPVAAAAAGQGGARARRTTLRTTRSKRKISRGRTKHHMKRTN